MNMFEPRKKTKEELIKSLETHLSFLQEFVHEYDKGKKEYYKKVATELRILLCDTKFEKYENGKRNRVDNSLLLKLFPGLKLHPIPFQPDPEEFRERGQELISFTPGTVSFNRGKFRYYDIFDLNKEPISVNSWLYQRFDVFVTIRDLIKSVADKNGGAHVDNDINETLVRTSHEFIGSKAVAVYIIEIGRYIISEISKRLKT